MPFPADRPMVVSGRVCVEAPDGRNFYPFPLCLQFCLPAVIFDRRSEVTLILLASEQGDPHAL
jgi:hypothetical protein